MSAGAAKIEVFYDIVSPYSYLGVTALFKLANKWNVEIVLRPFFLGACMKLSDNKPPASVPSKGSYMLSDLQNSAKLYYKVPLTMPSAFPANTLLTMRLLTVVEKHNPAKLMPASLALFDAYWGKGKDVSQSDIVQSALVPSVLSAAELAKAIELCQTDEIKQALTKTTTEAVERGAFGAPTIYVWSKGATVPTMYFGSDRLHVIAQQLGVAMPAHL